jgi:hypothetical protein
VTPSRALEDVDITATTLHNITFYIEYIFLYSAFNTWYYNSLNEERLPQKMLNWTPTGTRKRRGQKTRWQQGVLTAVKDFVGDWVSKDIATSQNDYIDTL